MPTFQALWQRLRDTTWIVPTALALFATGLTVLLVLASVCLLIYFVDHLVRRCDVIE